MLYTSSSPSYCDFFYLPKIFLLHPPPPYSTVNWRERERERERAEPSVDPGEISFSSHTTLVICNIFISVAARISTSSSGSSHYPDPCTVDIFNDQIDVSLHDE